MRSLYLTIGSSCFLAVSVSATIHVVKPDGTGDFPTIQAAVDASTDGAIVELTDGTFAGDGNRDIDYARKAIVIRSQSGNPDACIIDCQGSAPEPHRGFLFTNDEGPDSVLEGFTITNGFASDFGEPFT